MHLDVRRRVGEVEDGDLVGSGLPQRGRGVQAALGSAAPQPAEQRAVEPDEPVPVTGDGEPAVARRLGLDDGMWDAVEVVEGPAV